MHPILQMKTLTHQELSKEGIRSPSGFWVAKLRADLPSVRLLGPCWSILLPPNYDESKTKAGLRP